MQRDIGNPGELNLHDDNPLSLADTPPLDPSDFDDETAGTPFESDKNVYDVNQNSIKNGPQIPLLSDQKNDSLSPLSISPNQYFKNNMQLQPAMPMETTEEREQPVKELGFDLLLPLGQLKPEGEGSFRWDITNFNSLKDKEYSPVFHVGNHRFNILMFPRGNNGSGSCISLFLNYVPTEGQVENWWCCAQFAIAVVNPSDDKNYDFKASSHRFTKEENDWGFTQFASLSSLVSEGGTKSHPIPPIIQRNSFTVVAFVRLIKDEVGTLWHNFINWDSKAQTGYVGLKNQGATCYMNSLLQSLYFINHFRRATYLIPTSGEDEKSVPLALQRVFYHLQNSEHAVGTTDLTRSFGWDTMDSFMQHDVQEFNRVLQDNIESKMKGTQVEGTVQKLFCGKMKSYIKCVNIPFESSREEDFYDIQLNVKGIKNLEDSFRDYIKVEMLDGENKYQAEGHGLQDAKKGIIFTKFPPVLHLHLKRFEYDFERDAMVKIYDRYEFPEEISLDEFLLAPGEHPQKYHLHGVLVHSGDVSGGHYCAFLRPKKENRWFKFDDDRVIPITQKEAVEDNYGGEYARTNHYKPNAPVVNAKKLTSAYMLVYVRDSDRDEILKPVTNDDIPRHLIERFDSEKRHEIERRREREMQQYYQTIKIVTGGFIEKNATIDLGIPDDRSSASKALGTSTQGDFFAFKLKKTDKISDVFEFLESHLKVPKETFRLWAVIRRQNNTIRVDTPIAYADSEVISGTVGEMKENFFRGVATDFRLFLEQNRAPDGSPIPVTPITERKIMVFFKYYDWENRNLKYVGHHVCDMSDRVIDLFPALRSIAHLSPEAGIRCYEEIKPTMVDFLKPKSTLEACELGSGDIIVFQKDIPPNTADEAMNYVGADSPILLAPRFYDWILNRVTVNFKPCFNEDENKENRSMQVEFTLELSRNDTYEVVASKVASKLNYDPQKIRFHTQDSLSGYPKVALRKVNDLSVKDMLSSGYSSLNDTIFYEKLDFSVDELENKKSLRIIWVETGRDMAAHTVYIPKNGTVEDVQKALVSLTNNNIEWKESKIIRLTEISSHRIASQYKGNDSLLGVRDASTFFASEISNSEIAAYESGRALITVPVFHFSREVFKPFGIPFLFVILKEERFKDTKARLYDELVKTNAISGEKEFAKFRFVICASYNVISQLENDDYVLSEFNWTDKECLGLDHIDKSGKSDRLGHFEKSIKIHN